MTDAHDDLHEHDDEQAPEAGFMTDTLDVDTGVPGVPDEPQSATVIEADLSILETRPAAGEPREYHFPSFDRWRLDNGLTVLSAHMPGRALLAANLVMAGGGAAEPPDLAGVTTITGRALTEGTRRRDALAFIEASERLGAELHADASWEALTGTLEVPRSRFPQALALLAEMILEPALPESEIERLRDERLNDLLQAKAKPSRRAERYFPEVIFDDQSPYRRPLGGVEETVPRLTRDVISERLAQASDPAGATLMVAGDLSGMDLRRTVEEHFSGWRSAGRSNGRPTTHSGANPAGGRIVLVDRPGSAQSELRVGHVGLARKTPDFYAVAVLNAILGGVFDSRLNRVVREEKGYAYSIWSSFDMRRSAGPFVIRTAVETDVTAPALSEIWSIVLGMREAEVEPRELDSARDYLVGVFPLRFEVPAQVAAALAGLVIHELPDDELDRYRPAVGAITAADLLDVARRHIRPADLSVVVVGDASKVEAAIRELNLAPMTVVAADAES